MSHTICLVTCAAGSQCWRVRCMSLSPISANTEWTWVIRDFSILCATCPVLLTPARRVHWLLFISVTNALIYLETLLLDHSNILFKIIIWKITWQRTLLLFLLWKGARCTKALRRACGNWLSRALVSKEDLWLLPRHSFISNPSSKDTVRHLYYIY